MQLDKAELAISELKLLSRKWPNSPVMLYYYIWKIKRRGLTCSPLSSCTFNARLLLHAAYKNSNLVYLFKDPEAVDRKRAVTIDNPVDMNELTAKSGQSPRKAEDVHDRSRTLGDIEGKASSPLKVH